MSQLPWKYEMKQIEIKDPASLYEAVRFFQSSPPSPRTSNKDKFSHSCSSSRHQDVSLSLAFDYDDDIFGEVPKYLDDQNLTALASALESTSWRVVYFDVHSFLLEHRSLSYEIAMRFCKAVGSHPELKVFSWDASFNYSEQRLRGMYLLIAILQRARALKKFKCEDAVFKGALRYFAEFAEAIVQHPHLEDISFLACEIPHRRSAASKVNHVLSALSSVPNLKKLRLDCWLPPTPALEDVSQELIAQVCGHRCLEEIDLPESLVGQHFVTACETLRNNTSLNRLFLTISCTEEECRQLADIISALRNLEYLNITLRPFQDDTPLKHIITALQDNTSIANLTFDFDTDSEFISNPIQEAFVSMLKDHNFNLTSFYLSYYHGNIEDSDDENEEPELVKEMKHYVKLNSLGRKSFREDPNVPRDDWIQAFIRARGDVAIHYALLSMNPNLCDLSPRREPRKRHRRYDFGLDRGIKRRRLDNNKCIIS